ncbi:MAG: stress response protein [Thermoleophilaceae bacterium]
MVHDGHGEGWHLARLIPAVGIRGQEEQEKRATSSLLAVMRAVPEFGHALVGPLGAPKGRIATYAEVQVKDAGGKTHIPDGAIVVERGKTAWRCLVEVKTGTADLTSEQVNRYLDWARENRLDGVLTISNQITGSPTDSPVPVDGRKLRTTRLYHLSWWRIITEAIVQHRHRGVSDPDQAWILGELIAYLDDERSGASGFQDMGENWVGVRNGAGDGTLRATNSDVRDVAGRWEQFVEYLCLGLGQDLGRDVRPVRPRKQSAADRLDANAISLADGGIVDAAIRVPDAVGPLVVQADLRTRKVVTSVTVEAPGDGRPPTRVNWLLRQLKEAPDGLVVEVSFANSQATTAALLSAAREDPKCLLLENDPKRPPRAFRLSLSRQMGTKRGKGERSFVLETRRQAMDFYRELVQDLRPWRAAPPKLPDEPDEVPETAAAEPPGFSQNVREPGEGKPSAPAG